MALHGPDDPARAPGVISFTSARLDCGRLAMELDRRGILCRPGLHCAPRAHRTLGTLPAGTVRFSLAAHQEPEELEQAAAAVAEIAE